MSTIWDRPTTPEAPTTTNIAETTVLQAPAVAVLGGVEHAQTDNWDGDNWQGGQWNVRGGVPRGRTEHDRVQALKEQYPFAVSGAERLDAATRTALGR